MKIVVANPPNIDAIDAVFQVKGKRGTIFTYGDTIYNPSNIELTNSLKAHEGVHYSRQTNDPTKIERWWDTYLVDPEFRLKEELPAHKAEYRAVCDVIRDREVRAGHLQAIASRLAGPLYGNMLTVSAARGLIR